VVIVTGIFSFAGAGIEGQTSVSNVRVAFLHAQGAKWRFDIDVILLAVIFLMGGDGAPCECDKTEQTEQHGPKLERPHTFLLATSERRAFLF
jgi:hypothetical protein